MINITRYDLGSDILNNEIIDVDYEEILSSSEDTDGNDDKNEIVVNADPISALLSGVCGIVNNITNAAKEYGICKQQERTKREAIKAQMKVEIEKINSQKEICLKVLDKQYEIKMFQMQAFYEQYSMALKDASDSIHGAIEVAKESKNFSDVCALLEMERNILKDSTDAELKFMELSNSSQLAIDGGSKLLEMR